MRTKLLIGSFVLAVSAVAYFSFDQTNWGFRKISSEDSYTASCQIIYAAHNRRTDVVLAKTRLRSTGIPEPAAEPFWALKVCPDCGTSAAHRILFYDGSTDGIPNEYEQVWNGFVDVRYLNREGFSQFLADFHAQERCADTITETREHVLIDRWLVHFDFEPERTCSRKVVIGMYADQYGLGSSSLALFKAHQRDSESDFVKLCEKEITSSVFLRRWNDLKYQLGLGDSP